METRGTNSEAASESQPRSGPAAGEAPALPVTVRDVEHSYGELRALDRASFEVAAGETVALVGPSGCGKSTLLELIAGLGEPSAGTIAAGDARTAAERLERCAWMPQQDLLLPWRRAVDNAALGLRFARVERHEARRRAEEMLRRLGLERFERSFPGQLSGGMRQRVAFARTLLAGRPVVLLDEPLAALDAITRADLQEWLAATLRAERRTALLVTHDVEEALYVADRVLLLSPRPARVLYEARSPVDRDAPRAAAISAPAFVAARERALEELASGGGASAPDGAVESGR